MAMTMNKRTSAGDNTRYYGGTNIYDLLNKLYDGQHLLWWLKASYLINRRTSRQTPLPSVLACAYKSLANVRQASGMNGKFV